MAVPVFISDVEHVLALRGLETPDLAMLQATHQSYRALLLQPSGPIFADTKRIGHLDLAAAAIRADSFLAMAAERGDQLVVTPEYFLPVSSLAKAAQGGPFPAEGAIWVLGCESMTPVQLASFKEECAGHCVVIYEEDPTPAVQGNYFDPVAYCFVTRAADKNFKRVVLFQFKTAPSRDDHGFENKQLRCGRAIYRFQGKDGYIKLSTIICSDALDLGEDADANKKLSDRTVLIHIQLNPKPKHTDYRRYRNEVFRRTPGATDCDIICLNWAHNVVQHDSPALANAWKNESGSAWYVPERRCSVKDDEVANNEAKGLYYTWHEKRRHVLHFHYDEAVFALIVPKVMQDGPAVHDVLIGPQLDARFAWDVDADAWLASTSCPETGWSDVINANPEVTAAFQNLQNIAKRLHIERAISLSCGPHSMKDQWHRVDNLDVCRIPESEVVARATLHLDRDVAASEERHKRITRVAILGHILQTETLPPQIKDLAGGDASITWSPDSPNTNVIKFGARPALVAYLGDNPPMDLVKRIGENAFELLRKENKGHKDRVAICYRTVAGVTKFADIKQQTDITYDGSSMASITGGQ
ncbi:hypothetical protein B9Z44_14625 [Limnohabitans curvus]|uniref:Uncharacterized protein n=1 Tax=Limnohabitans curvus TaxID=323423 RepID=A0A315FT39_9BURK|nr:hypothetical protein [Limnohabitans curvus]PUE56477.1 hypothetical protein B9Z44_14625 [Limnohabitans curvus]